MWAVCGSCVDHVCPREVCVGHRVVYCSGVRTREAWSPPLHPKQTSIFLLYCISGMSQELYCYVCVCIHDGVLVVESCAFITFTSCNKINQSTLTRKAKSSKKSEHLKH